MKRGFQLMDPERHKQVAGMGGKAAKAAGKGYFFDAASGREAGKKGGAVTSSNREHMSQIGKLGGIASVAKRRAKAEQRSDGNG